MVTSAAVHATVDEEDAHTVPAFEAKTVLKLSCAVVSHAADSMPMREIVEVREDVATVGAAVGADVGASVGAGVGASVVAHVVLPCEGRC